MGSSASIFRMRRSRVPWTRSVGLLMFFSLGYRDRNTSAPLGKQGESDLKVESKTLACWRSLPERILVEIMRLIQWNAQTFPFACADGFALVLELSHLIVFLFR